MFHGNFEFAFFFGASLVPVRYASVPPRGSSLLLLDENGGGGGRKFLFLHASRFLCFTRMNGNGDGSDVHFTTLLASFLGSNSFFPICFTTFFGSSTSVRKVMLLLLNVFQHASICQVAAHHHWKEGRHHESWEMQSIHHLDDF
jgi:hypothetical protein